MPFDVAGYFDFAPYVGVPWLDRGRELTGCDCWGLHRLVYRDGPRIELPSFAEDYVGPADREAIQALISGGRSVWIPIDAADARPFDLVLMHDRPWHVGTLVQPGRMLHVPEGRSSVIEHISTGRFGRRLEGLYRHEALS